MTIHVSSLMPEDKLQWQQLYQGYANFYNVEINQQILDTIWQWVEDPQQPFFALVAKNQDDQIIGLMHSRAMPSPLRGTMVGFVDDIFVSPDHRGNGVVDAMFSALEQQAKQQGWPLVRWITADNNYRGRGAYEKVAERTHWITYQMNTAD